MVTENNLENWKQTIHILYFKIPVGMRIKIFDVPQTFAFLELLYVATE